MFKGTESKYVHHYVKDQFKGRKIREEHMGYANITPSNMLIEISNSSLLLLAGSSNKLIQLHQYSTDQLQINR